MNKSTNAEMELRISKIVGLQLQGYKRRHIIEYVTKKTNWGISERSVDVYIKKATKELEKAAKLNVKRELGAAVARLMILWRKSFAVEDYKTCLAIQKELSELCGLKKMKIDVDVTKSDQYEIDEDTRNAVKNAIRETTKSRDDKRNHPDKL